MLKFVQLSKAQRLYVVSPDFRDFMYKRWSHLAPSGVDYAYLSDKRASRSLRRCALEFLSETGLITQKRTGTSFALETLVMFYIGQISARYRTALSEDLEWSDFTSLLEREESLSLGYSYREISQWVRRCVTPRGVQ